MNEDSDWRGDHDDAPVLVRPSRDSDVEAMLAIYRHHIRRGVEDGVDDNRHARAGRSARPAQESAQTAACRIWWRPVAARWSATPMSCCSASARPIATRSSIRSTSTTSISAAASAGCCCSELIDACAAAGFRQMIGYIDADNAASLALHEKFGFARVGLPARRRLSLRPLGRHRHGAAFARPSPRRRRRRRSSRCADPPARMDERPADARLHADRGD